MDPAAIGAHHEPPRAKKRDCIDTVAHRPCVIEFACGEGVLNAPVMGGKYDENAARGADGDELIFGQSAMQEQVSSMSKVRVIRCNGPCCASPSIVRVRLRCAFGVACPGALEFSDGTPSWEGSLACLTSESFSATACSMETTAVIGRNLDIVFLASASLLIVTIPFRDLSLLMSFIAERMNLVCFFASPAMVLVPPVVASC